MDNFIAVALTPNITAEQKNVLSGLVLCEADTKQDDETGRLPLRKGRYFLYPPSRYACQTRGVQLPNVNFGACESAEERTDVLRDGKAISPYLFKIQQTRCVHYTLQTYQSHDNEPIVDRKVGVLAFSGQCPKNYCGC